MSTEAPTPQANDWDGVTWRELTEPVDAFGAADVFAAQRDLSSLRRMLEPEEGYAYQFGRFAGRSGRWVREVFTSDPKKDLPGGLTERQNAFGLLRMRLREGRDLRLDDEDFYALLALGRVSGFEDAQNVVREMGFTHHEVEALMAVARDGDMAALDALGPLLDRKDPRRERLKGIVDTRPKARH